MIFLPYRGSLSRSGGGQEQDDNDLSLAPSAALLASPRAQGHFPPGPGGPLSFYLLSAWITTFLVSRTISDTGSLEFPSLSVTVRPQVGTEVAIKPQM